MHSATKKQLSVATVLLALGLVISLVATSIVLADFTNGGFESGNWTGWTKSTFLNPGLSGSPPFTGADIVRNPGGTDLSTVVGPFAPMSQTDPQTNNTLHYPAYGSYSAYVNGPTGNGTNANSVVQQTTMTSADVDPLDGKVHVQFVYAPVLQEPGHPPASQAWMYIALRNITKSTLLYEEFIFAGQAGVPWQTGTGQWQFVDWTLVDVAPGAGQLDVGDTVEMEVTAAGCAYSAHAGYVYVDAFGFPIPGVSISGTGPASAPANSDITYTYVYRNGSGAAANNTTVTIVVPAQTTYVSVSDPACSQAGGTVTCNFGSLGAGATGTLSMTVHIDAGAGGSTIAHGNYKIGADGMPALLGPVINTNVPAAFPTTTTVSSDHNPSRYGQPFTFTANVTSSGGTPGGGTVTFKSGGVDIPGCVNVPLSGGQATCGPLASWAAGSYGITAEYSGMTGFLPSSGGMTQVVQKADTTTVVTSSANPSMYGQMVTFIATVSPVAPGAGIPDGTVTFYDGTTLLGTATLDGAGQATFTTSSPLAVGTHNIRAVYGGSANYNGSTGTLAQQVVWATDLTIDKSVRTGMGHKVVFTIVARNRACCCIAAPGAVISDTLPANLINATWTCTASGGARCGAASGVGNLYDVLPAFPPGGVVTYTVRGTLSPLGHFTNTAEIITPSGVRDIDPSNNRDVVVDDDDGVPAADEDINGDGNLNNDDTDGDGMPNYLDTDDDNDGIPTRDEDTNHNGDPTDDDADRDGVPNYLESNTKDTDHDGITDWLDADDDGDGVPTRNEDADGDGNPVNDDTDGDGIPNYLDSCLLYTSPSPRDS